MDTSNPISNKKHAKAKTFLSATCTLGIALGLVMLGDNDFSRFTKTLKSEVLDSTESTELIDGDTLSETTASDSESFLQSEETIAAQDEWGAGDEMDPEVLSAITTNPDAETSEDEDLLFGYLDIEDLETETFDEEEVGAVLVQEEIGINLEEEIEANTHSAAAEIQINSPQNFQVESIPEGIQLSWEGDAQNYWVYYGSQSDSYLHRVAAKSETKIFNQFVEGNFYFFAVSAVDGDGNESEKSEETSAIFSAPAFTEPAPQIFHPAASKPPQLSEEGPAETLIISVFVALGISFLVFRKRFV